MSIYFLFYALAVADKLHDLYVVLLIIGTISLMICTTGLFAADDSWMYDDYKERTLSIRYQILKRSQKILLVLVPIIAVLYAGTPTKKEAVLIVAGGYIGNFIQSDSNARALPADITRFLRAEINQAAKEAELGSVLEPTRVKEQRDSLSNLSKEQLVEGLLKKE